MKTKNLLLIGLWVIVIGGLVFGISGCAKSSKADAAENEQPTIEESGYPTKSSNGKISIDLTPSSYEDGKLHVDAAFNTHSGDLTDYDLTELVTLEFNGDTIAPISVPNLGGHHSGGDFVFELAEKPSTFDIKIRGIPDIEERIFSWP